MAHAYSHLYRIPTTGLRFFTVYGPWGRPDMAAFLFTKAIFEGGPIKVFNHGDMKRDFTYIDDIVNGIVAVLDKPATTCASPDSASLGKGAPFRIFNIGNSEPVPLEEFIGAIEACVGKIANKLYLPMQAGDVPATYADVSALTAWTGVVPTVGITEGIGRFVEWYKSYYKF
jgi:UDP-glucuronate 4-epimerase